MLLSLGPTMECSGQPYAPHRWGSSVLTLSLERCLPDTAGVGTGHSHPLKWGTGSFSFHRWSLSSHTRTSYYERTIYLLYLNRENPPPISLDMREATSL